MANETSFIPLRYALKPAVSKGLSHADARLIGCFHTSWIMECYLCCNTSHMPLIPVVSDQHFYECIEQFPLVLVDFYADWCEPCSILEEVLLRLENLAPVDLKILKVDVERHQELRRKHHVLSVPVLVLYRNGEAVWRMNGFLMEDELLDIILNVSRETRS